MILTARHIRLLLSTLMLGLSAAVADAQIGTGSSGPFWPVMTADEQAVAPSPEAASLAGYTDAVVDLASGQGSLSYDLLQWQVGGYAMKLGLSYRIGAFTTEEEAGWIALGWSLDGAGCVSRTIAGMPDERQPVDIRPSIQLEHMSADSALAYIRSLRMLRKDADIDRYSYSAPGISGTFVIVDGTITELPASANRIEQTGAAVDGVRDFRITAPDGTVYEFCEREHSHYRYTPVNLEPGEPARSYTAVSAWYLSCIITAEGADTVSFSYTTMPSWTRTLYRPSVTISMRDSNDGSTCQWLPESAAGQERAPNETVFPDGKILLRICSRTACVELDHVTAGDRRYISGMTLYNSENAAVRRIELEGSGDTRRQLTALRIKSGTELIDGHTFTYHIQSSQIYGDFFGYPNGAEHEGDAAPISVIDLQSGRFNPRRRPDFNYAVCGALMSTESASGMLTEYEYEPNAIPLSRPTRSRRSPKDPVLPDVPIDIPGDPLVPVDPPPDDSEADSVISIGIRIRSIKVTDRATGVVRLRTLAYGEGKCSVDFNSVTAADFIASSGITSFTRLGVLAIATSHTTSATILSGSRLPGFPLEGAHICYGRVEERVSGSGLEQDILTVYQFDLSPIILGEAGGGKPFPETSGGPGDNTPQRRSLEVPWYPADNANSHRGFFLRSPVMHYFKEHTGAMPLLMSRTEYEFRDGDYRQTLKESYFYRKIDSVEVTVGLFYEPLVRSVRRLSSGELRDDWQSMADISHFNISVKASRTLCDSVSTVRYFDDGSTRSRNTRYLYTSVGQPGVITPDIPIGGGHLRIIPEGTLEVVGGGTVWDCDSLSDLTFYPMPIGSVTHEGSIRTECHTAIAAMVADGFFRAAAGRGLRTLPVAQMWIVSDGERADTLMRRYEYGRFAGHGGSLLTLPTAIITAQRGCEPIDVQRIGGYTAYGRPVTVTQTGKPVMHYTWGYAGDLLTGVTAGGSDPNGPGTQPQLSSSFEHIPLVGCSRMVNPSGMVRQYGYTGGRLTSVSGGSGKVLQQYGYELYVQGASPAARRNCITASALIGDGGAMAVTRQYYNGFGALVATLTEGLGGDGDDVAAVTEYDALMRPVRQWVPLPLSASGLPEALRSDNALLAASRDFYGDIYGYSELTYAQSSDSRAVTAAVAGAGYAGHPTLTRYTCSNPADAIRKVTRWRIGSSMLPVKNGTYGAGELDCTDVTDGDGRRSLTFTDAAGRTVLQRAVADDGTYADTYYITDGPGNPLMVIPPEATKALKGEGNASEDAPIVENYCYIYRYDEQMRMISRHIPGRAAECFAYDCEGRLAYSRDGNLAAQGRRAFTLYDPLGRVAVTGTCADVTDESWWQSPSASHQAMTARRDGTAATGYVWDVALQDVRVLTVNYYDDYTFAAGDAALSTLPQGTNATPAGLPTGVLAAVIGPQEGNNSGSGDMAGGYLLSVSYYDAEERIIESRAQTLGGDLLTLSTAYTAGGVPKQTRTALNVGTADGLTAAGTPPTFTNDITVDRHGRPVTSVLTAGGNDGSGAAGGCLTWNLGSYGYNGVGRLASVVAQGAMRRNTYYDIHGWVTQWQTPYLSQRLIYGPEAGAGDATPSYTGLITAKITTSGNSERRYNYSYDGLGRLTSAAFTGSIPGEDYSTAYTYDLQGNMLRLTRKGLTGPGEYGTVDDVTATYTGNQLHTMRDDAEEVLLEASLDVAAGSYGNDAFDYDANGNLSRDMSRGIVAMEYNLLNLPLRATFADGSQIDWVYTAAGQKLRQTVIAATGDTLSRRDYMGPYLYADGRFDRYMVAEGYVTADSVLHAYIPDYQGNIVGVVNTATDSLEQMTDYYPYGLPFASSTNPTANRYKYGAKELATDLGLNAYDFEARMQSPALPMFAQIDPLAEKYYSLSPYAYCAGNPISFVDPSGMDIFKINEQGVLLEQISEESFDQVVMITENEGEIASNRFDYGIINVEQNDENELVLNFSNYQSAFDAFSTLCSAETIEWSLWEVEDNSSVSSAFLSTSRDNGSDSSGWNVLATKIKPKGLRPASHIHNHRNDHPRPSFDGISEDGTLYGADYKFIEDVTRKGYSPLFYIYTNSFGLVQYKSGDTELDHPVTRTLNEIEIYGY